MRNPQDDITLSTQIASLSVAAFRARYLRAENTHVFEPSLKALHSIASYDLITSCVVRKFCLHRPIVVVFVLFPGLLSLVRIIDLCTAPYYYNRRWPVRDPRLSIGA
jgi:hypothetical protein